MAKEEDMKGRVIGFCLLLLVAILVRTSWGATESGNNNFFGGSAGLVDTGAGSGNYNSFFGGYAGYYNYSGSNNSFFGYQAGLWNTTGYNNSFVGSGAGGNNSGGQNNSFVGYQAGYFNTTGYNNSFVGSGAGKATVGGQNNSFVGYQAGKDNTTGNTNSFFGAQAGYSNQTGYNNTFIGYQAGYANTGNGNIFIGTQAGYFDSTNSNQLYIDNCINGYPCTPPLIHGDFSASTLTVNGSLGVGKTPSTALDVNGTATATNFVGNGSGLTNVSGANISGPIANTTGSFNTVVGTSAGAGGSDNSSFGYQANPSGGNYNSSFGYAAGNGGGNNSSFGVSAGVVGGTNNSSFGSAAGNGGTNNSSFGSEAGYSTTGNGNVFIGYKAGFSSITENNTLYIDNCYYDISAGNCTSPLIKGDFYGRSLTINGTLAMTNLLSPSDERYKRNIQPLQMSLEKVERLAGVSYEWKTEKYAGKGFREGRQIGLIAQEVEKVFPELVQTDSDGYKGVAYDKLVPVLIEAVKEQQKEMRDKDARIERLEKTLETMERRMAALESPSKTIALK